MIGKIVSLIFFAALLLQDSNAATIRKARDVPTDLRAGQIRLTKFVMNELNTLGKIKMANSKKLIESVLNDPEVLEAKTAVMETYLEDFRDFIEHLKSFDDKTLIPGGDKILTEESALIRKYKNNDETKEAVIISKVLKKNGVENQLQLLEEPTMEYTNRFLPEAEIYIKILEETKANEEDKDNWVNLVKRIKAKTDAMKRGDMIVKAVETFGVEPEELI